MILAFADCELDVAQRELRRGGVVRHVEPQVLDLLIHLLRNGDRVVGKDELLDVVWDGRFVSDSALTSRISAVRRAIGDSGKAQTWLRTIPRRGFRFLGEVRAREAGQGLGPQPDLRREPVPTYAPRPVLFGGDATMLIGREMALEVLVSALATTRWLTLTGPGGVGKTKLALAVASRSVATFADGAVLVELAPLTDPAAVAHAVAGALAVGHAPGPTIEQSLVDALKARELLLVLDNCEHVIEAAAALARTLVRQCPRLTLLATSREALNTDAETVWPVPPLDCGEAGAAAARLFTERATAVDPAFTPGDEAWAVDEICRRLDGIPLAIELAAGRARAMSPSQILARLDDGFQLLAAKGRSAQVRHETLQRAIQWSFDLLTDPERMVLSRACVFAGGFTLAAAEKVCAGGVVPSREVLDHLDALIRKSLVTVDRSRGPVRYGLLETIRQFALQQLSDRGENGAVRARHAEVFAAESDANFDLWLSPGQRDAYHWLDREFGNLRAAFRWSVDHGLTDEAARIASNIGDMARFRLLDEAALWAAEITDRARQMRHRRLVVLLTWAASSAWGRGQLQAAARFGEEALALCDDPQFDPFVWVYSDLAMVASYEGDHDKAADLAWAGARHPEDSRDRFCFATLPYFLTVGGREDDAGAVADEAVAAAELTGIPSSVVVALWSKAKAFAIADPETSLAACERATRIARESGNRFWEILVGLEATKLQAPSLDPATALSRSRRVLDLARNSSDLMFVSHGLGSVIVLLARVGRLKAAATLNGALARSFDANPFVPELTDAVDRTRSQLGTADFAAGMREGESMSLREAHAFAISEVDLALATANAPVHLT